MSDQAKDELKPQGSEARTSTKKADGGPVRGDANDLEIDKASPPKTPDPVRGDGAGEVDKASPPKTPDPVRGDSTGVQVDKTSPPKTPDPIRGE